MSQSFAALEAEALSLTPEERARLADHLIASLASSDDIDRAWADEVERRLADIEAGRVATVPLEHAITRARQSLA
jgi:putative addiction module component (TIGR02574 family)